MRYTKIPLNLLYWQMLFSGTSSVKGCKLPVTEGLPLGIFCDNKGYHVYMRSLTIYHNTNFLEALPLYHASVYHYDNIQLLTCDVFYCNLHLCILTIKDSVLQDTILLCALPFSNNETDYVRLKAR